MQAQALEPVPPNFGGGHPPLMWHSCGALSTQGEVQLQAIAKEEMKATGWEHNLL